MAGKRQGAAREMKRWFSKDSVRLKIGIALLLLVAGLTLAAAVHRAPQHNTEVEQSSVAPAAAPNVTSLSERPKAPVIETKIETTEEDVPYSTTQTYDGTLPKDTQVIKIDGVNGKEVVKTEVKLKDGVEISRELISEEVTVPPVAKVVAIGTKVVAKQQTDNSKSCATRYSPCVTVTGGDVDCTDIGHQVTVVTPGVDPYNLDRDNDGIGCDNYPKLDDSD